jgi:hypothetical protein
VQSTLGLGVCPTTCVHAVSASNRARWSNARGR